MHYLQSAIQEARGKFPRHWGKIAKRYPGMDLSTAFPCVTGIELGEITQEKGLKRKVLIFMENNGSTKEVQAIYFRGPREDGFDFPEDEDVNPTILEEFLLFLFHIICPNKTDYLICPNA